MNARIVMLLTLLAAASPTDVTYDRLLHADREPHNWLSYSGNYAPFKLGEEGYGAIRALDRNTGAGRGLDVRVRAAGLIARRSRAPFGEEYTR